MKRIFFLLLTTTWIITSCQVQKSQSPTETKPLFSINDASVSSEDFKYAFLKNYRPNDSLTLEDDVKQYLDLYINFKLKVTEARALGYADRKSYKDELSKYQKDLAKPYLTESKVTEEIIQETYDRLKTEVKASHILIKVPAGQKDTTKAWNKIERIREMALEGADFDSLAFANSEDPSAKMNKGSLGYFTALQMVYPFENAAFSTEIGKVSNIVKTQFGYHIIKVVDKRQARGKMRVAHIMIRTPRAQTPEDSLKSKQKVDAIYQEILDGQEWKQLVTDYSEDPGSKSKGGELPWFGTGNFVPEFEEAAFSLDSINVFSKPFKTVYGWHIVKYLDKKGLEPFEKLKPEIERKIGRDSRSKVKNQVVLDRLKRENEFKKNEEIVTAIVQAIDSSKYDESQNDKILFELKSKKYTAKDFKVYFESSVGTKNKASQLYKVFEKNSILAFENDQLEFKYPEYRALLNEYRDGILLFDVMEQLVWQKASQDTTGLSSFYEKNKASYTKQNVLLADIYTAKKSSTIDSVMLFLDQNLPANEIETKMNEIEPLNLQLRQGNYSTGDNSLVDNNREIGIHRYEENKRYYLVHIKEIKAEVIPSLGEIKGKVISDFQDDLESSWLQELKTKYTIERNEEVLNKVISEIENSI